MQQMRKPDKPEMTDELKELNEEMLAHYQEGRYIVTVQEDKGIPILKQKDGKVYQPIFTDVQEVKKFQNLNKGVTLKTAVVEGSKIPEILSPEAFGVAVNPFGEPAVADKEKTGENERKRKQNTRIIENKKEKMKNCKRNPDLRNRYRGKHCCQQSSGSLCSTG